MEIFENIYNKLVLHKFDRNMQAELTFQAIATENFAVESLG